MQLLLTFSCKLSVVMGFLHVKYLNLCIIVGLAAFNLGNNMI